MRDEIEIAFEVCRIDDREYCVDGLFTGLLAEEYIDGNEVDAQFRRVVGKGVEACGRVSSSWVTPG